MKWIYCKRRRLSWIEKKDFKTQQQQLKHQRVVAWWVKLKINDIVTWVAVFITDTLCGCHNCTEETRKPQQLSSFWHPHTSSNCAFVKFLLCAHLCEYFHHKNVICLLCFALKWAFKLTQFFLISTCSRFLFKFWMREFFIYLGHEWIKRFLRS